METESPGSMSRFNAWVADAMDVDPAQYPASPAGAAAPPPDAAPAQANAAPARALPSGDVTKPAEPFKDPQANPFDAPEVRVEIEKLTLPTVQHLAVEQAQNAARDFQTAIANVKTAKMAKAAAEEAKRELMMSVLVTVALMPAGPLIEAAGMAIAGPTLRNKLAGAIADNAGALEKKFGQLGVKVADKSFDALTSEGVTKLAEGFDAAKAKAALDSGVDKLKDKTVKFAASSNKGETIAAYLDAVGKSANDAMHNLTDAIQTTTSYSEAVAYYNLFSMKLQASYEAVLGQQVDDMLSELADVLAQHGKPSMESDDGSMTQSQEEIAKVDFHGRKLLAHIARSDYTTAAGTTTFYAFRKWVTPDMEAAAAKMIAEEVSVDVFKDQKVPDPQREPGERVIQVATGGKKRLMLIDIEDTGIFWKEYGVRKFNRWAEGDEDEQALRSRGALQIGGIDEVPLNSIKGVPSS